MPAVAYDVGGLAEPLDRLGKPADVVGHRGHTGSKCLHERAALVELRPVRKECDGRLAERTLELGLRQVPEPPLRQIAGLGAVAVHGLDRIAGDEQARSGDPLGRCDRVSDPLVRPDRAEREQRAAVVGTCGIARENGMRDDGRVDAELGETLAATIAVDDDTVEAREKLSPEPLLASRPPRQEIVCREDRRHAWAQQDPIQLRRRQPLQVQDIRPVK